jgi:hypothetical protein
MFVRYHDCVCMPAPAGMASYVPPCPFLPQPYTAHTPPHTHRPKQRPGSRPRRVTRPGGAAGSCGSAEGAAAVAPPGSQRCSTGGGRLPHRPGGLHPYRWAGGWGEEAQGGRGGRQGSRSIQGMWWRETGGKKGADGVCVLALEEGNGRGSGLRGFTCTATAGSQTSTTCTPTLCVLLQQRCSTCSPPPPCQRAAWR